MKKVFLTVIATMVFGIVGVIYAALDDFNGPSLDSMWTLRDPASKATISFSGGKMRLDLKAGADMYIQGVDGGVMILMEPPAMDNYSVELQVNAATNNGVQAPACQVGIVFFNEAKWAYSAWGPYANTDIRVEDCVGSSYRWRDGTQVGIDMGDVAIDNDVWLKVIKTGETLEFLAKGNAGDSWVSGGIDTKLGPNYSPGDYKVGIIAKSWGGSIDTYFEFDYFDIPELSTTAVDPDGKLVTTWSAIRNK